MATLDLVVRVRELISEKFGQFGEISDEPPEETLLIRDGHFCGRRFTRDQHTAVWFVEENEIKFFDADGALRATIRVTNPAIHEVSEAA